MEIGSRIIFGGMKGVVVDKIGNSYWLIELDDHPGASIEVWESEMVLAEPSK